MRLQSIWNPNTLTVGVSALLERPSVWDKLLLTYLLTYLLHGADATILNSLPSLVPLKGWKSSNIWEEL